MDRGAWQGAIHGVTKESYMTQQLNNNNNKLPSLSEVLFFVNNSLIHLMLKEDSGCFPLPGKV